MILLLFMVTLIFCSPFLISGRVPGNFGDLYQYVIPFRHFATETLQTGHAPLWNPYIFSGTPFLASPQSALFYPGTLLFYFLPMTSALSAFTVLHVFLNTLGMHLLLKTFNQKPSSCLFGALAWGFSFFFLSKISAGHIIHLSGYSWFCFILLFLLKDKTLLLSAMALALMFFSGHLQVWMLTVVFVAAIWLIKKCKKIKGVFYILTLLDKPIIYSSMLAAGLVLVQALPTFVFSRLSFRVLLSEILGPKTLYEFASSYSLPPKALITLFLPDFFGNPMQGTFKEKFASFYVETYSLYFGLIPLFLGLLGFWERFRHGKKTLLLLSLGFIVLALGKNAFIYPWIWKIFSSFRVPARFYLLFLFLIIASAVMAWNKHIAPQKPALKFSLFILLFLDLFLNGKKLIWSQDMNTYIGKRGLLSQIAEELMYNVKPFRIFSGETVGNPNKAMMFRVENVNGYEALWQASALRYFAWTEGIGSVSTTGYNDISPEKEHSSRHAIKYYVSDHAPAATWPLKNDLGILKVYENPSPPAYLRPVFPEGEKISPSMECFHFIRRGPNKIRTVWRGLENCTFEARMAQAQYPGWEAWTDQGEKLDVTQADGYFQSAFVRYGAPRYKRIFWLFRPKDFMIGLWGTVLSVILLAGIGMRRLLFSNKSF